MQIFEAAVKALSDIGKPTHLRVLRDHIEECGYFEFGAVDPVRALGVAVDRHCKGVPISRPAFPTVFFRASPATYGLLEWLDAKEAADVDLDALITQTVESEALDSSLFLEQELQRWLYKNLEKNRLSALGYGPLELVDPVSQGQKLGKLNTGIVGEIDLLLKRMNGELVVCELKRRSDDQTVGQLCRYWGWVHENLAQGNKVHGLILAQEISDGVRYAIKATDPSITYRQLSLEVDLGPSER